MDGFICESFSVSGANNNDFNGKYEVTDVQVSGAPDKDVYQLKGKEKYIFWKQSVGWVIGETNSLTSGEHVYQGNAKYILIYIKIKLCIITQRFMS